VIHRRYRLTCKSATNNAVTNKMDFRRYQNKGKEEVRVSAMFWCFD